MGRFFPASRQLERRLSQLVGDSAVDFARLSPTLQADVVRRVASDRGRAVATLQELNPWLSAAEQADAHRCCETVQLNARTVRQVFGLPAIGRRLNEVYASLRETCVSETLEPLGHAAAVLESFIEIERLYPIRFA